MKTVIEQHAKLVSDLAKPGCDIKNEMTSDMAHELHMAVGVSGEAGELLDAIKKHVIYGKDLDVNNVVEELGDIEFYLEGLRKSIGITRNETLNANISKLRKRYESGSFSNDQAVERKDKQDG